MTEAISNYRRTSAFYTGLQQTLPMLLLIIIVSLLSLFGLLVLYSVELSDVRVVDGIARRQLIWFVIALAGGISASLLNMEKMRNWIWLIGVITFGLLLLVLVPGVGVEVKGAQRWIDLGPMNMQVSDFSKIGLIFILAHYLGACQREMAHPVKGFMIPIAIVGAVFLLIMKQPDFGTAVLVGVVGGCLIYLAGAKLRYLIPAAIFGAVFFIWMVANDPVRWKRITSFWYLEDNKSEGAYQLWQAIIAFGGGGWDGVGLGNGRQHLAFLPEAHTDFIFPVIGEELGFVFTALVVLLFFAIFILGIWQLRRAPNLFQFLLVFGALLLVTLQALINFGVVTGLLPTKGMSLPFISYGGSNLLATAILIGIILNGFRTWNQPVSLTPREL